MGGKTPKMMIPLLGKPLLYWAMKNLQRCRFIDHFILTVPSGGCDAFVRLLKKWNISKVSAVVEGGKERVDSVRKGLEYLPESCKWVGIHDGARVFTEPELIEQCFRGAQKTGSAILAVPCKDTLKLVSDKLFIKKTMPRSECWLAQTPQVFRRDLAEEIILRGRKTAQAGIPTDDASILELAGHKVRIVQGSYENIKITTPGDMLMAESLAKNLRRKIKC